jgi:hypothetical protein
MKKRYFAPEMEVVDLNMQQVLLTGSTVSLDIHEEEVTDPGDILSSEFNDIFLF